MASTPTPERIRLTITVTPEVHEIFSRLAEAGNVSLGRAMGDWLSDTSEAAQQMADLVSEARERPRQVLRQLHGMAIGLQDEVEGALRGMRSGKAIVAAGDILPPRAGSSAPARSAGSNAPAHGSPRPVIRGGKSPNKGKGERP